MEFRFCAMLCSNLGSKNSEAGHIKFLRGPQVPRPCVTVQTRRRVTRRWRGNEGWKKPNGRFGSLLRLQQIKLFFNPKQVSGRSCLASSDPRSEDSGIQHAWIAVVFAPAFKILMQWRTRDLYLYSCVGCSVKSLQHEVDCWLARPAEQLFHISEVLMRTVSLKAVHDVFTGHWCRPGLLPRHYNQLQQVRTGVERGKSCGVCGSGTKDS